MVGLGCSTILFGGHRLDDALASIAGAGYTSVELAAIPGMADHVPLDRPPGWYRAVAERVAAHGLAIDALAASIDVRDASVALPEADRRARLAHAVDVAATLGAPLLVTSSGGVPDDAPSFDTVVGAFQALGELADASGVRLAIKPHVGTAVYSTATARRFLADLDPTIVGINWDPTHLFRAGEDPGASLDALASRTLAVRLRDTRNRSGGPGSVEEQLPGNGLLDLAGVCARVRSLPIRQAVVEIVGARDLPLAAVDNLIRRAQRGLAPLLGLAAAGIPDET